MLFVFRAVTLFLSTPSARRATVACCTVHEAFCISIHALREEGDTVSAVDDDWCIISIHALREEGDGPAPGRVHFSRYFYPRPPRGGRRLMLFVFRAVTLFLSTPSARRATGQGHQLRGCHRISIHALREEGDGGRNGFRAFQSISIHALREEGDEITLLSQERVKYFYPRPPRGGRPGAYSALFRPQNISIHALREEGDSFQVSTVVDGVVFLSTPSARRATGRPPPVQECYRHFYPRPPRGGRQSGDGKGGCFCDISIHALREEGDDSMTLSWLPR